MFFAQAIAFKVARNHVIDFQRKQSKTKNEEIDSEGANFVSNDQTPDKELLQKEQYACLASLLKNLKPEWREIMSLRYYAELSFKEIAKVKQKPLGTILWQYSEALKQIKKKYIEIDRIRNE